MNYPWLDTVYCERANGRDEYWSYSDGKRHHLPAAWVEREVRKQTVRVVRVAVWTDEDETK